MGNISTPQGRVLADMLRTRKRDKSLRGDHIQDLESKEWHIKRNDDDEEFIQEGDVYMRNIFIEALRAAMLVDDVIISYLEDQIKELHPNEQELINNDQRN